MVIPAPTAAAIVSLASRPSRSASADMPHVAEADARRADVEIESGLGLQNPERMAYAN